MRASLAGGVGSAVDFKLSPDQRAAVPWNNKEQGCHVGDSAAAHKRTHHCRRVRGRNGEPAANRQLIGKQRRSGNL